MRPLNLATQPFRNETLPAVVLAAAALLLFGVTVQHALTLRRLLPARTSDAHRRVAELEAEAARLRAEARTQRVERPEAKRMTQWTLLKELVDRRAFSWTGLFAVFEQALPPGVRLLTISPTVEKGAITIEVTAATRSYEDGLEMIRALEDRPEFADVFPLSRDAEEGARFRYTMRYLAPAAGAPVAPAAPSPSPAGGEGAGDEALPEEEARAEARLTVRSEATP